jgi:choline dehydrogenase-like flavoprotein
LLNATAEISPVSDDDVPSGLADDLRQTLLEEWGAGAASRQSAFLLVNASETSPNPNSRVTLTSSRDKFGINTVSVDWRLNPTDLESLTRTYEILGQQFGVARLGRVLLDVAGKIERGKYWSQHHHIGTTRMHNDPRLGVVDATCRVHSVTNLFIGGSSVFPTSGSGTPTLSIVALAVRLADHLKEMLK